MTNDSLDEPMLNRYLSLLITKSSGKLRVSLTTGRGTAEDSSWLSGKGTPIARIVGNRLKGLKMRRIWYKHGGLITCQGMNSLLFFLGTLRFALRLLRPGLSSMLRNL